MKFIKFNNNKFKNPKDFKIIKIKINNKINNNKICNLIIILLILLLFHHWDKVKVV